ncbi:MAG: N-acetylmuramoyl-L-alanine amidase [Epsilonproteobacteria bacterium]|nr:N-acetylmuramoyl-L-alanine amidase [Campylobacterota bacterium]
MKRQFLKSYVQALSLAGLCLQQTHATLNLSEYLKGMTQAREINRINWVEVCNNEFSTQIMFDFTSPIYFERKLSKDKLQLQLAFPGMRLQNVDVDHVIKKLDVLKKDGLLKNVSIVEKLQKVPKIVILLEFESEKTNTEKGKSSTTKNKLLIRWNKMEEPNRLILDIFTQENLEKIKAKNQIILQAQADKLPTQTDSMLQLASFSPKRIVIDPGHGQRDLGAQGHFSTTEKHITLDIAKKLQHNLKQEGYAALLTRSEDTFVSLKERSELATQLKADLFVSIHVNSSRKKTTEQSGIETFYLSETNVLPPTRHGGFFFVNMDKDHDLEKLIDAQQQNVINVSKNLAHMIQSHLIQHLKTRNIDIIDRGLKSDNLRVLLRASTPAALVEVGFISNIKEAKLLSKSSYRALVAQGIGNGIRAYLNQL